MPNDLLPESPAAARPEPDIDLDALQRQAQEESTLDLDALEKQAKEDNAAEEAHIANLFRAGFTKDADTHARVIALTTATNAPAEVIERRLPEFEKSFEASRFAEEQASRSSFSGGRKPVEPLSLTAEDPFIRAARAWRQEYPETADLLRRRPELAPVVRKVPDIVRAFRAFTEQLLQRAKDPNFGDAVETPSPDGGRNVDAARPQDAEGLGAIDAAAAPTETKMLEQGPETAKFKALDGMDRERVYLEAAGQGFKQQKSSLLGTEAIARVVAGGEIWDLEKQQAEIERDLQPKDYGSGFWEEKGTDTANIVSSQATMLMSGGAGAVAGAGIGLLATRTTAGAAAGANIGARLGATGGSAAFESGSAFWDFRKLRTDAGEALTDKEAAGAALIYGAAAAGIEGLSFGATEGQAKVALRSLLLHDPQFRHLAVDALKAWAGKSFWEGVEEFSQTSAQGLIGYLGRLKHAGEVQRADPGDTLRQAADDFLKAGVATGLTGAGGPVLGLGSYVAQRQSALENGRRVAMVAGLTDHPAVVAAPDEIATIIARATQRGGEPLTAFHVEPGEFLRLFQGNADEANAAAVDLMGPDGPKRLQQSIATGTRIEVPVAEFLEKWGSKPIAKAIANHVATSATGETTAQALAADEAAKKIQEEFKKAEKEGKPVAYAAGEEDFAKKLEAQLAEIQGPEAARKAIQPTRALIRTMSARFNIPADKLFAQYLVSVEQEGKAAKLQELADRGEPEASVALKELTKDFTPEQRAQLEHIHQGSGLREVSAFDSEPVPEGQQVAVFTSPTIKPVNDDVLGGHGTADPLIAAIGKALHENGHPETARSGTNLLIHVPIGPEGDAEIERLHEVVRAAVPHEPIAIRHGLGADRKAAGEALDANVEKDRKEETLPLRGVRPEGLDVTALKFPGDPVKTATVPGHLIDAARNESHEAFFERVLTEPKTGLLSRKGRDLLPRKKHQVMIDLRNIGLINRELGKEEGDILLRTFGSLMRDLHGSDFNAAHLSGDEYALEHDDPAKLEAFVALLRDVSDTVDLGLVLDLEDGSSKPVKLEFRHGLGASLEDADRDLNRRKQAEGQGLSDAGGSRGTDQVGQGQAAANGTDEDRRLGDLAARRDALARGARSQGFPGSRGRAFQEAVIADLRPQGVRDAQAFVDRMKSKERREDAQRWFNWCVGILRKKPSDVSENIRNELAAFGVVDPDDFELTAAKTGQKSDAKAFARKKGKHGEQPANLNEYRMRSRVGRDGVVLGQPDTRSAAFKAWFKDSKVVDKKGEPLRVFHGTNGDFSAFDPKKVGSRLSSDAEGFFFTDDPAEGSDYAAGDTLNPSAGANVMPVYLSLQRPLVIDDAFLAKEGMAPAEHPVDFYDNFQAQILEWVKKKNADGVIVNAGGRKLYVAFKPEQIKSATGNRGTFDPNDSNILFQPGYHGSPHRFEGRFSLNAIGTGEGAQVFGWGLYFAQNREIAEHYRRKLAPPPKVTVGGRVIEGMTADEVFAKDTDPLKKVVGRIKSEAKAAQELGLDLTPTRILDRVSAHLHEALELNIHLLKEWASTQPERVERQKAVVASLDAQATALERLLASGDVEIEKTGQLYEVDVPEDDELLDYDRPFKDQPEQVKAKLSRLAPHRDSDRVRVVLDDGVFTVQMFDESGKQTRKVFAGGEHAARVMARRFRNEIGLGDEWPAEKSGQDIYRSLAADLGSEKQASMALRDAGIPGLRFRDASSRGGGEGTHNYVIWDEARISDPETFYQPPGEDDAGKGKGTERGYTEFVREGVDRIAKIVLRPNADMSTFLHESAHVFLDMFEGLAARADAPAQVKEDFAATRKWMGLEDGKPIEREHHEKWARTFEAYLREGKEPSASLRRAFTRFRLWLTSIYKSVAALNPSLTPEIRGVFDRLIATDEEIASAQQRMGFAEPAEKTPEALRAYEESVSNARRRADLARVKDIQRETEAWWEDEKAALTEKLEEEYEAQPARKAQLVMRGKVEGLPSNPMTLDRKAVEAAVGPDNVKKFLTSKKNGVHPDELAEAIQYQGIGADLLKEMAALPAKDAWVESTADERMKAKFPGILEEREQLRKVVEDALHNPFTAETLFSEIRALEAKAGALQEYREERLGTPPPPMVAYSRAAAEIVAGTEAGKLAPGRALQAERQAADRALKHAAAGEFAQAAVAKRQQLLNMFLYRELTDAKGERDSLLSLSAALKKEKARQKAGKVNPAIRDGIDTLLVTIGQRDHQAGETPVSIEESVSALEESGASVLFEVEPLQALVANPRELKRLKVSEMRVVAMALKSFQKATSTLTSAMVDGRREDKTEIIERIAAEASANLESVGPIPSSESAMGPVDWLKSKGAAFSGSLWRPERILRRLAGGDLESTIYRALFKPLQDARFEEAEIMKTAIAPLVKAFDDAPAAIRDHAFDKVDGKKLFPTHRTDVAPPTRMFELYMMFLNAGNASNLKRLTEGRNIDVEHVRAALNLLSPQQARWLQSILDRADTLWAGAKKLEEKLNGVAPEKIEAQSIALAHGTYAGGYFPAVYDPRVEQVGLKQELRSLADFMDPSYIRPGTPHSHLKRRAQEFSGAISLEPRTIFGHFAKVAHDTAFREPVLSVGGLLMDPRLDAILKDRLGPEQAKLFRKWLQDVGGMTGAELPDIWSKTGSILRRNSIAAALAYRLPTMLGDVGNFGIAAVKIGPRAMFNGLTETYRNPAKAWKLALEKSGVLRTRDSQLVDRFRQQVGSLTKRGGKARAAYDSFLRHGFTMYEMVERLWAVPVWLGAYRQAQATMSEADAIAHADANVNDLLPSHHPLDQPAVARNRYMAPFLVFYSWHNTVANEIRDYWEPFVQSMGGGDRLKKGALAASATLFTLWCGYVVGEMASGRGPEAGDGDSDEERYLKWQLRKMATGALQPIPFGGDVAGVIDAHLLKKHANQRGSLYTAMVDPSVRAMEALLSDEKATDEKFQSVLKAAAPLAGFPTYPFTTPGQYLLDVAQGDKEPTSPQDFMSGLVYGSRDEQPANPFKWSPGAQ